MKITKSQLKQIIKEEIKNLREAWDDDIASPLAHQPEAPGDHGCKPGFYYNQDLHVCIKDEIDARRLKWDYGLGARLNAEVKKLKGWSQ